MRLFTKTKFYLFLSVVFAMLLFTEGKSTSMATDSNSGNGVDSYTISLVNNNGNAIFSDGEYNKTIVINAGDAIGHVADPYDITNNSIFNGWYEDIDCSQKIDDISTYVPTSNMTIYSQFTYIDTDNSSNYSSVTYNFNGGTSESNTHFIECGATQGIWYFNVGNTFDEVGSPKAYKDYSAFDGWYFDKECTQKVDSSYEVKNGDIFYAGWTSDYYTITIDAGDGYFNLDKNDKISKYAVKKGEYFCFQTDIYTNEGLVLEGYYTDKELSKKIQLTNGNYKVTGDTTLYVKWENGYKVTFDYGIANDTMIANGKEAFKFVKKGRLGNYPYMNDVTYDDQYIFDGWYLDSSYSSYLSSPSEYYVNSDMVIYSKWVSKVDIIYNAGDGYFYNGNSSMTVPLANGDLICTDYVVRNNDSTKYFKGWSLTDGGKIIEDETVSVPANVGKINLFAVYEDGSEITFDSNGGDSVSYFEKEKNGRYGRETSENLVLSYKTGTKIYEDRNNDNYIDIIAEINGSASRFVGWSTSKSEKDLVDLKTFTLDDKYIHLYAIWGETQTVTFDANSGYFDNNDLIMKIDVAHGSTLNNTNQLSPSVNNDGDKIFSSWNTQPDGSGETITDINEYVFYSDMTLYAQWYDAYTITLDANGGYFEDDGSVIKTTYKVTAGENFYNNYNAINSNSNLGILGWSTDPEGNNIVFKDDGSLSYKPDKSITLYAIWKTGYRVTYHANASNAYYHHNGQNVTDFTVVVAGGNNIKSISPYTVNNDNSYYFNDYNTKPDGSGERVSYNYSVDRDIDIYAQWIGTYKVKFNANGGYFKNYYKQNLDKNGEYSVAVRMDSTPYFDEDNIGHDGNLTLFGWSTTSDGKNIVSLYEVKEETTLYAVWSEGYNVTLDGNGGKVRYRYWGSNIQDMYDSDSTIVARGKGLYLDNIHGIKDGYILKGWATDKAGKNIIDKYEYVPDSDVTLYAIWAKACTVTYDGNGGRVSRQNKFTITIIEGSTFSSHTPVHDEKGFVEWNTKADGTGTTVDSDTVINSDITVYAIWSEGWTVTLDGGLGYVEDFDTYNEVQTYTYIVAKGKSVYASCEAPDDYIFSGWYEDSEFKKLVSEDNGFLYTPTKDVTLYAKFDEGIIVTFNGNSGWVWNNDEKTYSINVRKGHKLFEQYYAYNVEGDDTTSDTFSGWYKEPECKTLVATRETIADYIPTEDITLYAGFTVGDVKVKGIQLGKSKVNLGIGDSFKLPVMVIPANAANKSVSYSSTDTSIVSVDTEGYITGVNTGEATVTVTTQDSSYSATCTVIVDSKGEEQIKAGISSAISEIGTQKIKGDTSGMKKTIKSSLEGLGTVEAMADKAESNSTVANELQKLEETYVDAANVTVVDSANDSETVNELKKAMGSDADTSVTSVSGAGLNADPNKTVKLEVKATSDANKQPIDDRFNSSTSVQIDMDLTVGDNSNSMNEVIEELVAPVTITLPIPRNITKSNLYVLHFNSDGTYELIKPVFANNAMTITVSHFSTFAIVELANGESISSSDNTDNNNDQNTSDNSSDPSDNSSSTNSSSTNETSSDNNSTSGGSQQTSAAAGTATETSNGKYVVSGGYEVRFTAPKSKKIKKVKIESSVVINGQTYKVTSIESGAFKNCKKLTSVTIPSSVTEIGSNAFAGCKALKKVTVPSSVTTISKNAFKGCSKLNKITIKSKNITSVGKNAFKGIKNGATIKVPKSVKKDYEKLFKKAKLSKNVKIK